MNTPLRLIDRGALVVDDSYDGLDEIFDFYDELDLFSDSKFSESKTLKSMTGDALERRRQYRRAYKVRLEQLRSCAAEGMCGPTNEEDY